MRIPIPIAAEDRVAPLALAKREEELYTPDRASPVQLPRTSPTLTLLRRQRDEAHAFALLSHRFLRHSKELASVLDGCGLTGEEQARLRSRFGSARALRAATADEVAAAVGAGCGVEPRLLLSRLRSRPSPAAPDLDASLTGHTSAVSALALSSRRSARRVEAWAAEEQARRWWSARRGVWLSRLARGG